MFKTEGSEYFILEQGPYKGCWIRERTNDAVWKPLVYIGSINTNENPCFKPKSDAYDGPLLKDQLSKRDILGLTDKFVVGNAPFGILGINPGDIQFKDGRLVSESPLNVSDLCIHVGHNITEVFEQ